MKHAIVIGATSGMGKNIAKLLAENGYKVAITGRRLELLENLKNEKPDSYIVKQFDICNLDEVNKNLNELVSELEKVDLIFLSSGTGEVNKTLDFEIEQTTINTNVTGFTFIAAWAFRHFEKQGFGHFAAITSIAGLRGGRASESYNASKAYQINYLESLRQKAAHLNKSIFITDIRPGFVNTDMAKGEGLFWVMPVDKASKQIFNSLKSKKKVAYITKRWGLIGFILKFIPNFIFDKM